MPYLASTGAANVSSALFVLAFLWLSLAVGRRMLRVLDVLNGGSLAERGIVAAALGVGILQFVPYTMGVVGLLGVNSLRLAMGAVTLAMAPDIVAVARHAWPVLERWANSRKNSEGWLFAWAVALTPGLVVVALLALTPTIDPDGLAYHLTAPKRWLANGNLNYLPTYYTTSGPMGVEMLFTIALAFAGDIAAKLLHFSLGLVGAAGLYLAGRRFWGRPVCALAVTLCLVGPGGLGTVLGFAYVEGATAFAMIAATLAWIVWFQERRPGWLRCAWLLAGVAVSFKIVAVLFPLALGALTLLASWDKARDQEHPLLPPLTELGRLIPLVAAPIAPWLVRSAILTGNPLFPLFANVIPSRDFSAALATRYDRFNRYLNWGSSMGAHWSLEQRQLIIAGAAIGVLLVGTVVIVRLRSWMARAFAVVLLGTVIVQLLAAGLYVRYWVPLLSVLQLPLVALFERALSGRWGRFAVVLLTLLASVAQARRGFALVENEVPSLVRTAVGLDDRRAFLLRHVPLLPIYEQANRELPADSRILLNGSCGGFYLDRTTFCADFPQEALRFTSWSEFVADLRRLGVTHVITRRTLATGGPLPPPEYSSAYSAHEGRNHEFVAKLLTRQSRLLVAAADQGLYEVDVNTLQ